MSWVLFFDGDCGFCSASVRLVARLDQRERIFFAPLQGELARRSGLSVEGGTMVLMRESDGAIFTQSDALIELACALGGLWRVLTLATIIPKSLRDGLYRWVARNRVRLTGRTNACSPADSELLKRLRN